MTLAELKANAIASTLNPPIANNHPVPINPSRVGPKHKTGHFFVQPVMDLKKITNFYFGVSCLSPVAVTAIARELQGGHPEKILPVPCLSACPLLLDKKIPDLVRSGVSKRNNK
ncbi:hypothetical protein [Arthrospira sp. PCC 8006]|uniref:hypothetical protein n=1 Tax=Oscillatoriales TaxID=1150 RepID=UPI00396F55B4